MKEEEKKEGEMRKQCGREKLNMFVRMFSPMLEEGTKRGKRREETGKVPTAHIRGERKKDRDG